MPLATECGPSAASTAALAQRHRRFELGRLRQLRHRLLVPLLAAIKVGKNFMFSHGYIENDFDVNEWAAPEFMEKAAAELLEEEWTKRTMAKLPEATALEEAIGRIG